METSLAYLAGIIDGEGCIRIEKTPSRPNGYATIQINMTCKKTLDYVALNLGGTVVRRKVYNENHRPQWKWRLKHLKARTAISAVLPYLITKSIDAKNVLKHFEDKGS